MHRSSYSVLHTRSQRPVAAQQFLHLPFGSARQAQFLDVLQPPPGTSPPRPHTLILRIPFVCFAPLAQRVILCIFHRTNEETKKKKKKEQWPSGV